MMQLPEQYKPCPNCGFANAALIMDLYGVLPQLDEQGDPQYYCTQCDTTFTAFDEPSTTPNQTKPAEKEGDEHGHDQY
jgi:transposase-like protein